MKGVHSDIDSLVAVDHAEKKNDMAGFIDLQFSRVRNASSRSMERGYSIRAR